MPSKLDVIRSICWKVLHQHDPNENYEQVAQKLANHILANASPPPQQEPVPSAQGLNPEFIWQFCHVLRCSDGQFSDAWEHARKLAPLIRAPEVQSDGE